MIRLLKKVSRSLPLIMIILLAALLFLFPDVTVSGTKSGLQVCAVSILPLLFPFFVISNIWSGLGYSEKIGSLCSPMMKKLFHLPGSAASALLLGLVGGYPVGAQSVISQYRQKQLTSKDAEHLLMFCNNAGPAFIFGVAGQQLLHSPMAGAVLYLIHIASAIMIGILFRPALSTNKDIVPAQTRRPGVFSVLTTSVRQAGQAAVQVCTFVIFFSVLISYLQAFLTRTFFTTLLLGSVELASGVWILKGINNEAVTFCLISFLLGWGGFCVAFQTLSILDETDLSQGKYLMCKLLHGLISFLLAVAVVPLLPLSGQIFIYPTQAALPLLLITTGFILIFLFVLLLKKTSGNAVRNQL